MVTIRLSRGGAKKQPFYHIVATDSRARRDGRYIERLGYYNPVARGDSVATQVDLSRIDHWVRVGAQMSDRVRKILKEYRKNEGQQSEGQKSEGMAQPVAATATAAEAPAAE